jgi:hypothetical protein
MSEQAPEERGHSASWSAAGRAVRAAESARPLKR